MITKKTIFARTFQKSKQKLTFHSFENCNLVYFVLKVDVEVDQIPGEMFHFARHDISFNFHFHVYF